MPHRLPSFARLFALVIAAMLALTACQTSKKEARPDGPPTAPRAGAPIGPAAEKPRPIIDKDLLTLPQMKAERREPVRIGFLAPLSGAQAALGRSLLESAELAIFESGRKDLLLLPQDTEGTPGGAIIAINKVIVQGAEIVLGPLLAEEVSAVAPIAEVNDVPVVAFSSDMTVARPGVYLLSFPPQLEVDRIIDYAAMTGVLRIAALIPENSYGTLIETAFRAAVAARRLEMGPVEHYPPTVSAMMDPVRRLSLGGSFDAVLLPEGGANLRALAPLLPYSGIDTTKVKVLGTGLWDDPSLAREGTLHGGWFAAPAPEARQSFASRYRAAYGSVAPRIASLAYDAVALAAALADGTPGRRFTTERITHPNGFSGVDGIFRFGPDGRIERGLAVNQVTPGGMQLVSPAPTTFQAPTN